MSTEYQTISEELAAYGLAIENGLKNEQIKPMLEEVGYGETKLQHGQELYERAAQLAVTQTSEHGEQHGATDDKNAAWEAANTAYMSDVKLARVAIKKRGDLDRLALNGEREDDYAGWKKQAEQFYTIALAAADLQTQLLEVNLTTVKLQAHFDLVKAAETARLQQATEKGEAEDSTDVRNAALKELRAWMGDYIAAARVALQDRPQLLEILGIKVLSEGTTHQTSEEPAPAPVTA